MPCRGRCRTSCFTRAGLTDFELAEIAELAKFSKLAQPKLDEWDVGRDKERQAERKMK
jgi:hypothetical protein